MPNHREEIIAFLKEQSYQMTIVAGALQFWRSLKEDRPCVWLKISGEGVELYVETDFDVFKRNHDV